jgi:hypothetical protein
MTVRRLSGVPVRAMKPRVHDTESSVVAAGIRTPRSDRKESQATSMATSTASGTVRRMSSSMRRAVSALA